MARKSTIETHKDRGAIEAALLEGQSLRNIAEQYSVSVTALHRHKNEGIHPTLSKAQEAQEAARADDLLAQVRHLQVKALNILEKAEKANDLKAATGAIREARACLELLAKLQGELDERPVVNLTLNPVWLEVRSVLLVALEPFPEAREAVAKALQGVNS